MSDSKPSTPRSAKTMRGYSLPDEETLLESVGLEPTPIDNAPVDPAALDEDAKTIPAPAKGAPKIHVPPADRTPLEGAADDAPTDRVPPRVGHNQPLVEIEVIHEHGPRPSRRSAVANRRSLDPQPGLRA